MEQADFLNRTSNTLATEEMTDNLEYIKSNYQKISEGSQSLTDKEIFNSCDSH